MTLQEIMERAEKLRPNTMFGSGEYISWLNTVEEDVSRFMERHVVKEKDAETGKDILTPIETGFTGYDADTDTSTEALLPNEWCDIYVNYLICMMDYYNGEFQRYNNALANIKSRTAEWKALYRRQHLPAPSGRKEYLI